MIQIVAAVVGKIHINGKVDYVLGVKEHNEFKMPWSIPSDLQHFKKVTKDTTLVMGYNTWCSIGKRMLPGRPHIVVTRDPALRQSEVKPKESLRFMSLEDAVSCAQQSSDDFSICGGGQIYKHFVQSGCVDRAIISSIEAPLNYCSWGKHKTQYEIDNAEFILFEDLSTIIDTYATESNEYKRPAPEDDSGYSILTFVKLR